MNRFLFLSLLAACAAPFTVERDGSFEVGRPGGRVDCVPGTLCEPHAVRAFPFSSRFELSAAPNVIRANSCDWDAEWLGGEQVFELDVPLPGTLQVGLATDAPGVRAFLFDRRADDACVAHAAGFAADVAPGTYLLVVDSGESLRSEAWVELQLALEPSMVADDPNEPNDTLDDAWTSAYLEMEPGTQFTERATLTPASPLDWWIAEGPRGAQFHIRIPASDVYEVFARAAGEPELVRLDPDGDTIVYTATTPGCFDAWDDSCSWEAFYLLVQRRADAAENAWADYTIDVWSEWDEDAHW